MRLLLTRKCLKKAALGPEQGHWSLSLIAALPPILPTSSYHLNQNTCCNQCRPAPTICNLMSSLLTPGHEALRTCQRPTTHAYTSKYLMISTLNLNVLYVPLHCGDRKITQSTTDATARLLRCSAAVSYTHLTLPTNREV